MIIFQASPLLGPFTRAASKLLFTRCSKASSQNLDYQNKFCPVFFVREIAMIKLHFLVLLVAATYLAKGRDLKDQNTLQKSTSQVIQVLKYFSKSWPEHCFQNLSIRKRNGHCSFSRKSV